MAKLIASHMFLTIGLDVGDRVTHLCALDLGERFVPHAPALRRRGGAARRYGWAELLARVFLVDVLACPHCGGRRKVLAAIHDPGSIRRVLEALGLPAEAPELAPARGPPGGEEWVSA